MDQASFTDSNVEGVYGLSSAQEGKLLHTLREPDAGVFFLLEEIEEADS
jgi:hypothetical protein